MWLLSLWWILAPNLQRMCVATQRRSFPCGQNIICQCHTKISKIFEEFLPSSSSSSSFPTAFIFPYIYTLFYYFWLYFTILLSPTIAHIFWFHVFTIFFNTLYVSMSRFFYIFHLFWRFADKSWWVFHSIHLLNADCFFFCELYPFIRFLFLFLVFNSLFGWRLMVEVFHKNNKNTNTWSGHVKKKSPPKNSKKVLFSWLI